MCAGDTTWLLIVLLLTANVWSFPESFRMHCNRPYNIDITIYHLLHFTTIPAPWTACKNILLYTYMCNKLAMLQSFLFIFWGGGGVGFGFISLLFQYTRWASLISKEFGTCHIMINIKIETLCYQNVKSGILECCVIGKLNNCRLNEHQVGQA